MYLKESQQMTQAREWDLKVITAFGGKAFPFLIDNDT